LQLAVWSGVTVAGIAGVVVSANNICFQHCVSKDAERALSTAAGACRSFGGAGNMLVKAESTFLLADAAGPELDQGALLRLLGELTWLPTAYLDHRYIRWSAVDDRHAAATLTVAGRSVTAHSSSATMGCRRGFQRSASAIWAAASQC
jgi:hypothetical protein